MGNYEVSSVNKAEHLLRSKEAEERIRLTQTIQQNQEESFSLREYLRIFWKHRFLIISFSFVIVLLTALYSFLATPLYTSTATIEIGTYAPHLPRASLESNYQQETRQSDYLNTQIARIRSLSVANKAFGDDTLVAAINRYFNRNDKEKIQNLPENLQTKKTKVSSTLKQEPTVDEEVINQYSHPVSMLKRYLSLVSIHPIKKTSLVKVEATTSSPELSTQIARAHSKAFIDLVRTERQDSTLEELTFLEAQAEELAEKVAAAERERASYAEEHAIVSLNKDENITIKKMELLNRFLTEATAQRIQAEMEYLESRKSDFSPSMAFNTESMEDIRLAIKEAEAEYAMMSKKFKPQYPRMIQMKGRVDALREHMDLLEEEARKSLNARYQAKLESETSLKEQLEVQQSKAFELSRLLVTYNILEREYESVKDLHQSVLRQLKEAQVAAQSSGSTIFISEHATLPTTHSHPNRSRNILLALFLAPLIGFCIALVLEALDNTFHSPRDVERLLKIPTLGVVPLFGLDPMFHPKNKELPDSEKEPEDKSLVKVETNETNDLVAIHSPNSIASESFRSIRTALQFSSADKPPKILVFTSGQKGEGKTTVIANISVTFAGYGEKVIVIDSDLRRPSLHLMFGVDGTEPGLSDVLIGAKTLEETIVKTKIDNLYFLPAGTRPPNPAELLGSSKMQKLLDSLSGTHDYVFIDTPPVLPVTDAVALARSVDGVVLTVRGQDTQKHIATLAVARLDQVGAKILGVVLNNVDVRSDYHYYYGGAYSYHYGDKLASNA